MKLLIEQLLPGLQKNVSLAPYTTFKVGGPAKYLLIAKTPNAIVQAIELALDNNIPFCILGAGSNILASDRGFPGLVIRLANETLSFDGVYVTAGAGVPLQTLIQNVAQHELAGLEYLVGIPGSVGGSMAGNAGTATQFIGDRVSHVHVYNIHTRQRADIPHDECSFAYRNSRFKYSQDEVILAATFQLEKDQKKNILERMAAYIKNRKKQPAGNACAGCVFKNPPGLSAGKLIDEAGLKGKTIGKAQVSYDHANFIVNLGGATAEHIVMLISYIKQQVRDKKNIQLHEEIRYIGF